MRSLKSFIAALVCAAVLAPVLASQTVAGGQQMINQYVSELQLRPDDIGLREKIIAAAQSMTPRPAVPEEANRHFIRASVFVKEAQSQGDLDAARSELHQALLLAPWWGAGYYYLAVLEEETGRFDDAAVNLKLYLLSHPAEKNAKVAQDRMYAIEVEKGIAAKRRATARAAAEKQQEDAAWQQLKAALDAQDAQAGLAGPWIRTSGMCTRASIAISNGGISGSMTFVLNTTFSDLLGSHASTQILDGAISATVSNGSISGQANFPGYKISACSVAATSQQLAGSLSADGRSLELDTTATTYASQTQGLIIPVCVSITPASNVTARCFLSSQAPHLIPLIQVAGQLPPGAPNIDQAEAVRLVLKYGGDANQADAGGFTALHVAAQWGNSKIVELLLQNGAQANALSRNNDPPLTYAIESGSVDTVNLLLAHGAQPDLVDNLGMSPLYVAVAASGALHQQTPPEAGIDRQVEMGKVPKKR